jgi:response regulator RpfG family c-di-GMP phosphodiesterase
MRVKTLCKYKNLRQSRKAKQSRLFAQNAAQSEYETSAAEIALNHHEYWNESGYPGHVDPNTGHPIAGYENGNGKARGKREEELPIFGRIVAIADVYNALSCRRVFRDAISEAGVFVAGIAPGSRKALRPGNDRSLFFTP